MRAAVYIRPENEEAWAELSNKSEWVNDMLSGDEPSLERKIRRIAAEVFEEKANGGY